MGCKEFQNWLQRYTNRNSPLAIASAIGVFYIIHNGKKLRSFYVHLVENIYIYIDKIESMGSKDDAELWTHTGSGSACERTLEHLTYTFVIAKERFPKLTTFS